jgi:predicted acyltransferase
VESVDLLRGLTIFVMLFVNDLASVSGAPPWLKHIAPPDADGMTLPDVVFPAFLFIVGLSLPLALERRLAKGDTRLSLVRHVALRAASLLIIGVFMVNSESMSPSVPLGRTGWSLTMYAGVILVWLVPRSGEAKDSAWLRAGRLIGGTLLLLAALLYRGTGVEGAVQLRPHWWGILGLIGWAYLVAGLLYLVFRRNPAALLGLGVLLYGVYLADRAGAFAALDWLDRWVDFGSMLGSHAAIVMTGVFAGRVLFAADQAVAWESRVRWALLYGLGLAAGGMLLHQLRDLHPMFFVNKIAATPAWCLLSSAWTIWTWAGVSALTDGAGVRSGHALLRAAGQNALLAFILGPVLYSGIELIGSLGLGADVYGRSGASFGVGLLRSLAFAALATWLTGYLWRRGWLMRL